MRHAGLQSVDYRPHVRAQVRERTHAKADVHRPEECISPSYGKD